MSIHFGKLDNLQASFVHALDMTVEVAFLHHNFAPPTLRRDIGILGFLHKRVLNRCHTSVARLFPSWVLVLHITTSKLMITCANAFAVQVCTGGLSSDSLPSTIACRKKLWTCLQYQHFRQHSHELLGTVAHLGFPHGPSVFTHERR